MEKLIELLNEYRSKEFWYNVPEWEEDALWVNDEKIISKRYGFIKWLVDNDKIDIEKIENSEYYLIDWFYYNERKNFWIEWKEDVEKIFLMLLAVSDTPIDDLVSYLK